VARDHRGSRAGPLGDLREEPGSRELFVVVHGLGGGPASYYCLRAARAIAAAGASSLCLALRGADRLGEDFYNVAQREDLAAALASRALARYERICVLGYSMGGYVALHYARGPCDPRVAAVAAVCTPLDLHAAQRYIDTPRAWLYRRHVLGGLKEIYAAVARRGRPVPSPLADVTAVRTMYEWDRLAIVPRYGFASVEQYYDSFSIVPHLTRLSVPALLVASERDPIVPASSIRPFLPAVPDALQVRWVEGGGHVTAPGGLEAVLIAWCRGIR